VKLHPANPPDKPVLDQAAFQYLLAAAYALQEENSRHRAKQDREDFPPTLVDHGLDLAQGVLETEGFTQGGSTTAQAMGAGAVRKSVRGSRGKMQNTQSARRDELFWRAARVLAMAAVVALLLVASIDRLSPFPSELALPLDVLQQPEPFHKAKRVMTSLAQSKGGDRKAIATQPHLMAQPEPAEPIVVSDDPAGSGADPAPAGNAVIHSAYESEADMVARNIVVRHGTAYPAARAHPQKP